MNARSTILFDFDLKYHKTRFPELEFAKLGPRDGWSFFNVEEDGYRSRVGPIYRRKDELLADLTRYARECWGLE